MQKRLAVITKDRYLFQKIRLISINLSACELIDTAVASEGSLFGFDHCIWDIDSAQMPSYADERYISVGKGAGADLCRPFERAALLCLISDSKSECALRLGERCVYFRGREIRLTELEFSLLKRLVVAKGEFVSREEILSDVWGNDADGGIINVYVHYLREKLELDGEKVITSSRKSGYKIEEKFLKGGKSDA